MLRGILLGSIILAGLLAAFVDDGAQRSVEPASAVNPEFTQCETDECRFEKYYDAARDACRSYIQRRISARSTNGLTRAFFDRYRVLPNGTIYYYGSAMEVTYSNGYRTAGSYTCVWLTDNTLGIVILNGREL